MAGQGLAKDWIERVCLVWPFPYLGSSGLWSHIPVGVTSCIVAMQACLLGSFWRWIQVASGLIQSWRTIHRCKCGISLLWRQQLASLSLCLHISIQFQWGPCWQRLWVCHFAGVLHQGLPVRHQLVLSQEVMGQNTWGWCHWWQLLWPTEKQHHRWRFHVKSVSFLSSSHRGAVKVDRPGMKGLRYMWLGLRTLEVWWCLWVLVRHVWHRPFLGLGGHH